MAKVKQPRPRPTPDIRKVYQLAERYSEASDILAEQAVGDKWASFAPRMLVESFAVELYLKCLHVQDWQRAADGGHDLKKLFESLKPVTQTMIRAAFRQIIESDTVLRNLDVLNPDAVKVTDFDRTLAVASNTFDKRRYLYEEGPGGEWYYAHILKGAIQQVTRMDLRILGDAIPSEGVPPKQGQAVPAGGE